MRGALGAEMPCPAQNRNEDMALATKPYFICKRNEHYMENDLIHSCATAYSDLERDKYEIIFVRDNSIQKLDIFFTEKEFKHLTGVQHLKDITDITDKKSEDLYNAILALQIHETQLYQSSYYNVNLSDPNNFVTVADRINELSKLKQVFENIHPIQIQGNIQPVDLQLYKWDKEADRSKRPYRSSVKADFLLEIKNPDGHFTSLHLALEPNNTVTGVSLTPCNTTRSNDGRRQLSQSFKILSFKQINIENPTIENEIISISTSELAKIEADLEAKRLKEPVNREIRDLKKYRNSYLDLKGTKAKPKKINDARESYENRVKKFSNEKIYGKELLKAIKNRLEEIRDTISESSEKDRYDAYTFEINYLDSELKNRQNVLSNIDITVAYPKFNMDGTIYFSSSINITKPKIFDTVSTGVQMFIHDVGMTVRGISADIKDFFANTTKGVEKQSDKNEEVERPAKVEKTVEVRTEKIDRSNKPNLSAVMESKKKEAAKYNKERTVSPQQHKKNKGRDDI